MREKLLSELPLQGFNLLASGFVVQIQRQCVYPFIGAKANRVKPVLKQLGMRRFAGTRQAAER